MKHKADYVDLGEKLEKPEPIGAGKDRKYYQEITLPLSALKGKIDVGDNAYFEAKVKIVAKTQDDKGKNTIRIKLLEGIVEAYNKEDLDEKINKALEKRSK